MAQSLAHTKWICKYHISLCKNVFQTDKAVCKWYNKEDAQFICPAGRKLYYLETQQDQSKTGFEIEYRVYHSKDCTACPLQDQCTRSNRNRTLSVSFRWQELKKMAKENLSCEHGHRLMGRGHRNHHYSLCADKRIYPT